MTSNEVIVGDKLKKWSHNKKVILKTSIPIYFKVEQGGAHLVMPQPHMEHPIPEHVTQKHAGLAALQTYISRLRVAPSEPRSPRG